jgi:hypothetical protein
MEELITPGRARRRAVRLSVLLLGFLFGILPLRAQTTNLLNLCTEGALQSAIGMGGIFQFGDCGTNVLPTISLTQPLVVEHDVSLMATQEVLVTGQSLTRLFVVKPGVHLTLQNIFLFSGHHTETNLNDGGIPDTAGAGIYNDRGIVTILNGHFEGNSVVGVTGFAGRAGSSDDGEPGGDAAGGAIYNNGGQLTLSNVVFIGNSVAGGPGGAGAVGTSSGRNGGNGGVGGAAAGAAIYSRGGTVTVYASTFTTNNATGAAAGAGGTGAGLLGFPGDPGVPGDAIGAAIASDGAQLTVYGCMFFGNVANGATGLAGNAGAFEREGSDGRSGGNAAGGAIFSGGQLAVTNSTFYGNAVRSGNGGAGGAGSSGSIFGTSGGRGGNGGNASGGAIETSSGHAVIVNCTFSDNLTTGGSGGAGGVQTGVGDPGQAGNPGATNGGAIYGRGGDVTIANNILANSTVTVGGNVTDRGGNLSTDLNTLLVNTASMRLVNPLLSGPANNGGPTQTMAIATNSPAINHGVAEFCPQFDQRWSNRVDLCDIGAFEVLGLVTSHPLPTIPTSVLNGLIVSQSTNLVTLSWPAGYTNLFLQFATDLLSSNTGWTLAPQAPTTNSGSNVVSIDTANTTRPRAFFRLFGQTNLTAGLTNAGPPNP